MSTPTTFTEIWGRDVLGLAPAPIDWLWHGFLARGNITLLTSLWKAGKTTLLALLLARREHGGELAGLAVKPGKTVVVSEEPVDLWSSRARCHRFGNSVCFLLQPFRTIPRPADWQRLLDRILVLRRDHGADLLVLDPHPRRSTVLAAARPVPLDCAVLDRSLALSGIPEMHDRLIAGTALQLAGASSTVPLTAR